MKIVLTHEQADFDAIAALYAAAMLFEAKAVLPHRINRNVRAFINLFGLESSFITSRELSNGPIDHVLLVDTQSLVTLKGMGRQTRVSVFDHHPRRLREDEADKNWDVTCFELGATTTYFIRMVQQRGILLNSRQASLFLLGIYEDTGSLTYSNTTSEDLRAAAWLLEQGADLAALGDYLNPALNDAQRKIYEHLIANIETLEINGNRLMIGCAVIDDPAEELSILAHKLRDTFDPDAVFVLIESPEGVRLVARSTNDQVDVSAIAAAFHGGGHSRAAAALVKHEDSAGEQLVETLNTLKRILPLYVQPALIVEKIMSRKPHLLGPEISVSHVYEMMSRYGYEGFPVVDEGKIIGLLTRRAVDRAVNHKMDVPARSLMEAGTFSVHPADSLQKLQTIMAESGWGQVPVTDSVTGRVIGIVTRTDVLKALSVRQSHRQKTPSLTEIMTRNLSPVQYDLIKTLADEAAADHLPIFIVGGFVRDLLLGSPTSDFDIVVEGDAILIGKSLQKKYGGNLSSHPRFGTARWHLKDSQLQDDDLPEYLDLISSRQEFYQQPTALPTIEHASIKLDLHRRDFTINTLAIRLDGEFFGELHDYYGGRADLERKNIRVLHSLSFVDDPTRILRAVRYEQRYAFSIEERTINLIMQAKDLLDRLTPERIRHEYDLILLEKNASAILSRLHQLSLLTASSPLLPWNLAIEQRMKAGISLVELSSWSNDPAAGSAESRLGSLGYCLWLMQISLEALNLLHQRFQFPLHTLKALIASIEIYQQVKTHPPEKPSGWAAILDGAPILSIYAVHIVTGEAALKDYVLTWRHIRPFTNGKTLIALGYKPGQRFQHVLASLRAARLDGELQTREDEEILLKSLLES